MNVGAEFLGAEIFRQREVYFRWLIRQTRDAHQTHSVRTVSDGVRFVAADTRLLNGNSKTVRKPFYGTKTMEAGESSFSKPSKVMSRKGPRLQGERRQGTFPGALVIHSRQIDQQFCCSLLLLAISLDGLSSPHWVTRLASATTCDKECKREATGTWRILPLDMEYQQYGVRSNSQMEWSCSGCK